MKRKKNIKSYLIKNKNTLLLSLITVLFLSITIYLSYAYFGSTIFRNLLEGGVTSYASPQLNINYMVENRDSSGVGNGTYTAYWNAPVKDYVYNANTSYCSDGATFTRNADDTFNISSGGKTRCEFYYDAADLTGDSDIKINVHKEIPGTCDSGICRYEEVPYYEVESLSKNHILNETSSSCSNGATITYESSSKKLKVNTTSKTTCNAYFDEAEPLNEHIISLHSGVDGTNNIYYTNDSEYRYTGKTPNNYVTFNDEVWRIVGVFSENTHGQAGQQLVKIIREDILGNYTMDASNVKDWTISDTKEILNNHYYNSSTATIGLAGCGDSYRGICSFEATGIKAEYRGYIKEVAWKLGGNVYDNLTASHIYGYERGTTVYTGRPTEWSGKIGLMYPSDYGYASEASCYTTILYDYDGGCYNSNWLYSGITEWTITPYSSVSSYLWIVYDDGRALNYDDETYKGFGVRPTLYLKSEVKIIGGDGTLEVPYELKMG